MHDTRPGEGVGTQIGHYKLLEQIGEGGMGTIWLADQREPVRRRVALKIIKLGMDTKEVIARFEAERQALAMMDHPHIAKVFDAGVTATGRPYFVMEYIKGVPIIQYCDQEKLDTEARLELFIDVCDAIQHAHQKGIIHRDIKPSNVLVSLSDGVPVPKVIDFGIAKATNSELTTKTLFTEHGQIIGTPAYMSPEQADMSGLDIDTRSDIYSLGVLLYELLTGTTPFDIQELLSKGFGEMMRAIRDDEPHKPSTRISALGETAARTAQQRRVDVVKLGTRLRGDIDWIVMKCLEKNRTRRYDTASGLAADIRRHLNDEPVTAGAPGAGYKLRKFVSRNRWQVIAASVVLLAVLAGVVGTAWGVVQSSRARSAGLQRELEQQQRAAADSARLGRNAEAVSALLRQSEQALRDGHMAEARVVLDSARKRSAEGGAEQEAERLQRLAADLALVSELDAIDQFRWTWTANAFADPIAVLARTRAALQQFGADPDATSVEDAAARTTASVVRERIVSALDRRLQQERSVKVRALLRRVDADPYRDAVRDAVHAGDRATLVALAQQAKALDLPPGFAICLGENDTIPVERRHELLQAAVTQRSGNVPLLMALGTLAYSFPADPESRAIERLRWFQAAIAANPGNVAALNDLGGVMVERGQPTAAAACLEKAIALDPMHALAYTNLGNLRRNAGRPEEAIVLYRKAVDLAPNVAVCHSNLGRALQADGRLDEAIACYRRTLAFDPRSAAAYRNLGSLLVETDRLDEAIACFRESIALDPKDVVSHLGLGRALAGAGLVKEAVAADRMAVELDPKSAFAQLQLGALLCDVEKDFDGAIVCFEAAIDLDPTFADARVNLGVALIGKGRVDEAVARCREAIEIDSEHAHARVVLAWGLARTAAGHEPAERGGLRQEALGALREAVALYRRQMAAGKPADRGAIHRALADLRQDADLADIRDAAALAELPAEQRDAFLELWAEVAELERAATPTPATATAETPDPVLSFLEQTLARQKAGPGTDSAAALRIRLDVAVAYQRVGRPDLAVPLLEERLELLRSGHAPGHPDIVWVINELAVACWSSGQLDKSIPLFEEIVTRHEAALGRHHADTLGAVANLGVNYRDAGRLPEAIALLEEARPAAAKFPSLAWVTGALFEALVLAEPATAAGHWARLIPALQADLGEDHFMTLMAMNNHGFALARSRQFADAGAVLEATIEREVRILGEGHMLLLQTRTNLGELRLLQQQHALAEELLRRCLAERAAAEPDSFRLASTQSLLGRALAEQQEFAEAESLLLAGCKGLRANAATTPGWGSYYLPDTLGWLAELYEDWGRPAEAASWRAELAAIKAKSAAGR